MCRGFTEHGQASLNADSGRARTMHDLNITDTVCAGQRPLAHRSAIRFRHLQFVDHSISCELSGEMN
jgi:hypothetical protein